MSNIRTFPAETYELFAFYTNYILLEWDLARDTFYVSPKWIDAFGYEPHEKNFSYTLFHTPFIHTEDRSVLERYLSGVKQTNFVSVTQNYFTTVKIRFINMLGEYVWCDLHLLTIFSQLNHPVKILGMISKIYTQEEKNASAEKETEPAEKENTAKEQAQETVSPSEDKEKTTAAEKKPTILRLPDTESFYAAYDTLDLWLYVVDKGNWELKFVNRALASYLGHKPVGRKCYSAFFRREAPCGKCPLRELSFETRRASREHFDRQSRRWWKIKASRLPQIEDCDACLLQIYDITAKKEFEYLPTI